MYIYLKGSDKPIYTDSIEFHPNEIRWAVPVEHDKSSAKYDEVHMINQTLPHKFESPRLHVSESTICD